MRISSARSDAADEDVEPLRALTQCFVRAFGLLATDRTPCGRPIPLSYAHALMVLREAHTCGKQPTQRALSQALAIDKSNVARLCAKMEAEGHLRQNTAPNDGRSRLLTLTPRGLRLAADVDASSRRRFAKLLARVPSLRRAEVLRALDVLAQAAASLGTEIPE